ncbi:unnamed protein product [Phytophthora fragariaefolia]|uniref:Unnamed protein product n=1 Tax=Phytophthora fragariaefolia TaxID=1490495 RepID=A0A9W6U2V2_9STRA|nr:unnamed protein product [Phytophthora fragariaefolia]
MELKRRPSSAKNPPSASKKRKASSAAKAVSFFMDALAEKVPQQIRDDKLYERASKLNVSLYELAYPWKGSRLFFDPALYPHVHVGHGTSMIQFLGLAAACSVSRSKSAGPTPQEEDGRGRRPLGGHQFVHRNLGILQLLAAAGGQP